MRGKRSGRARGRMHTEELTIKKCVKWEPGRPQESLASDPKALGKSPCLRDIRMRNDVR